MQALATFLEAHPAFAVFVFWPLLTAVLIVLLRRRSPEELAAMHPYKRAFFMALAASGLDVYGVLDAIKEATKPPPPRPPPGMNVLFVVFLCLGMTSCTAAQRRAALVLSADVLRCVVANQDLPNERIAMVCGVDAAQQPAMLDLLSASRTASANAAVAAAAREQATCAPR